MTVLLLPKMTSVGFKDSFQLVLKCSFFFFFFFFQRVVIFFFFLNYLFIFALNFLLVLVLDLLLLLPVLQIRAHHIVILERVPRCPGGLKWRNKEDEGAK